MTVQDWDEARHAQNALEMLRSGDWIVARYAGEPDLWNLKPPLGVWLIASSFAALGVSEFALRFWAAASGVGSVLVVFLLGRRMRGVVAGVLAGLLLLGFRAFSGVHGCRTGDHDAPLTFFMLLALDRFHLARVRDELWRLRGVGLALGLAVLTKGPVGLLPALVFGLDLLAEPGAADRVVRSRHLWLGAGLFTAVAAPWFVVRALVGPEFFHGMWRYDLLERLTEPIEGHVGDAWFYVRRLRESLGDVLFGVFCLSVAWALARGHRRPELRLLLLWIAVFMGLFTLAASKLAWYVLPVYPAAALLMAVQLDALVQALPRGRKLAAGILLAAAAWPVAQTARRLDTPWVNPNVTALRELEQPLRGFEAVHLLQSDAPQSIFFYLSVYVWQVRTHETWKELGSDAVWPGHAILTSDPRLERHLDGRPDLGRVKKSGSWALFRKH